MIHLYLSFPEGWRNLTEQEQLDKHKYPLHLRGYGLPQLLPMSQCQICNAEMPPNLIKSHISTFHGDQMPYSCKQCGKGFLSHSGFYKHRFMHQGRKFTCPVCDRECSQRSGLKSHLTAVHNMGQCLNCQAAFKLGHEFDEHISNCG